MWHSQHLIERMQQWNHIDQEEQVWKGRYGKMNYPHQKHFVGFHNWRVSNALSIASKFPKLVNFSVYSHTWVVDDARTDKLLARVDGVALSFYCSSYSVQSTLHPYSTWWAPPKWQIPSLYFRHHQKKPIQSLILKQRSRKPIESEGNQTRAPGGLLSTPAKSGNRGFRGPTSSDLWKWAKQSNGWLWDRRGFGRWTPLSNAIFSFYFIFFWPKPNTSWSGLDGSRIRDPCIIGLRHTSCQRLELRVLPIGTFWAKLHVARCNRVAHYHHNRKVVRLAKSCYSTEYVLHGDVLQ